jgi:AcrR family transcriptional regulator
MQVARRIPAQKLAPDKRDQMSGKACCTSIVKLVATTYITNMAAPTPTANQRALRTRATILDTFTALVLERRYDTIRIADIINAAGIGRTTFYEHFRSKNDVLLAAMEPVLLMLSTAASGRAARSYVKDIVSHLWGRRSIGRTILNSATAPIIQRQLAALIRINVERAGTDNIAPSIKAAGISAAQIAMLRSWLGGEASCTVDEVTDQMIGCSRLIT